MKKNITLSVLDKINLLLNLNNSMIANKSIIYDVDNFDNKFVKIEQEDIYYHSALFLIWKEEKSILSNVKIPFENTTIQTLEAINSALKKYRLEYKIKQLGGINMKNLQIREIKDYENGGVYVLSDNETRKILSADKKVVSTLNVFEKINMLQLIIDGILNNKFNYSKMDIYSQIFSVVFDNSESDLEKDINGLYNRVILSYFKPQKDYEEITKIKRLLSKIITIENDTSFKVKYLSNEKVCYM